MSKQPRSISNNNTPEYYEQQQQQNEYQLNPQHQQQTAKQLHQLPMQQSQSDQDNDEDILDKIDSLLLQNQSQSINTSENQLNNNKSSQREMLLNFKITQLQKIINNLNLANKKLRGQLDEQQEYYVNSNNLNNNGNNNNNNNNKNNQQSNSNILNNSSTSQSPFTDQLTQMHGEFQQIQHLITEYKQQLAASEKKWNIIKQQKDQQIDSLKSQLIQISQNKDVLESEMQRLLEESEMLKVKNQQLLMQVDNLEMQLENANQKRQQQYLLQQQQQQQTYMLPSHQYMSPSQQQQPTSPRYYQRKFDQFQDYRFNQKIQRQMQNMIKKLLKQLSNEKKINTRMSMQIKRLNGQVIQMEKKIKLKNDANYQLEMKIIHMEKMFNRGGYVGGNVNMNNNLNNVGSNNNSNKPLSYLTNIKNTPLTPTQSNKNQSRLINNKYQPRTAQQQQKLRPREQMMNMKDYQANNQYTDQSDRNNNNYDDYVVTSVPLKSTRSPGKGRQQQYGVSNNIQQKQQQAHNFIKPKKQPQLPKSKNNNNISTYHHQQQQKLSPSQKNTDKSLSLNRQFMSFTIMYNFITINRQLEQGKIKITMKQKIIIISKLIELYCKKIRTQNYQNLTVEEIQVYNFNDKHPNLVRIRVVSSAGSKTDISTGVHEENQESLMYNLAFIVESLVKDVQTIDRQDLQVDLNLGEIIEEILNKNMEQKIAYFQQLSKSLENSVMNLV